MPEKYCTRKLTDPETPLLRKEEAPPSSTSTKTVPLFCFGLRHGRLQGKQLEKAVRSKVPDTNSKIVIVTEVYLKAGDMICAEDQVLGAIDLDDAFKALLKDYSNLSIIPVDRSLKSHLMKDLSSSGAYFAFEKSREKSKEKAYREASSFFAAGMYINFQSSLARSKIMLNTIMRQASDNPGAALFFVAGGSHVEDILEGITIENAQKDAKIIIQPAKLNDVVEDLSKAAPEVRYSCVMWEKVGKMVEGMMGSDKPFGETGFQRFLDSFSYNIEREDFEEYEASLASWIKETVGGRIPNEYMREVSEITSVYKLSTESGKELVKELVTTIADKIDISALETLPLFYTMNHFFDSIDYSAPLKFSNAFMRFLEETRQKLVRLFLRSDVKSNNH